MTAATEPEPEMGLLYQFDWLGHNGREWGTQLGWWDGRMWYGLFNAGSWSPQYVTAFRPLEIVSRAAVLAEVRDRLEESGQSAAAVFVGRMITKERGDA